MRTRVISLTKKNLGFKSLLRKTTEPIVQLLSFASLFRVYCRNNTLSSGKEKVLFNNVLSEKSHCFRPTNLVVVPLFDRIESFVDSHSYSLNCLLSSSLQCRELILQHFLFLGKNFFEGNRRVSDFLANWTPVIRINECPKTFEEDPRTVFKIIMLLISITLAKVIRAGAKMFSMPMKDDKKQ